ncbi:MAG TPA: hypothetical protein VMF50_05870, partial [Candidatus Binataceae bacterium]|nr:hypothetical protein [Candidatus Binataceae bacterium]
MIMQISDASRDAAKPPRFGAGPSACVSALKSPFSDPVLDPNRKRKTDVSEVHQCHHYISNVGARRAGDYQI